jgi:hypothetical protein
VFFAGGEIYSLFPAPRADSFGVKCAPASAGLLCATKGTGALLVPMSGMIAARAGGRHVASHIAASVSFATAPLAALARHDASEIVR